MGAIDLALGPMRRGAEAEGLDLDFARRRFWRHGRRLASAEDAPEWMFARGGVAFGEGNSIPLAARDAGMPRWGKGGLLLEGVGTNLISHSVAFEHAAWVKIASGSGTAPVVLGTATDPAGGTTARRVTFSRGSGDGSGDLSLMLQSDVGSTPGGAYVGSTWVRADTPTRLLMRHVGADAYLAMEADATWRRFHMPSAAVAAASNFQIGLRGGEGVAETATVELWNAQCEVDQATSDVVTGASPGSRAADELGFGHPGSEFGTIVMDATPAATSGARVLFEGAGLRVAMPGGLVSATTEGVDLAVGEAVSAGQTMRVAVAWEPGRVTLAVNGSLATEAGAVLLGAVTVGRGDGDAFFGTLGRWRRLDRAVGDAALAAVTT